MSRPIDQRAKKYYIKPQLEPRLQDYARRHGESESKIVNRALKTLFDIEKPPISHSHIKINT